MVSPIWGKPQIGKPELPLASAAPTETPNPETSKPQNPLNPLNPKSFSTQCQIDTKGALRRRPKVSEPPHTWGLWVKDMGGCQNYGPFLGTLNIRCRIIIGTQKGTIILTTTHMELRFTGLCFRVSLCSYASWEFWEVLRFATTKNRRIDA